MRPARRFIVFVFFLALFLFFPSFSTPAHADWVFDNKPPEVTLGTYDYSGCTKSGDNITCIDSNPFNGNQTFFVPSSCSDPSLDDGTQGSGCLLSGVYYYIGNGNVSCPALPSDPLANSGDYTFKNYEGGGAALAYIPASNTPTPKTLCAFAIDNAGNYGASNYATNVAKITLNFLYWIKASVFNDANQNGVYEPYYGETVYTGGALVDVSAVGSLTSDASGRADFGNLGAGTYTVTFHVPAGYFTTSYVGSCSPGDCTGTTSTTVALGPDASVNFGIARKAVVSGALYFDQNESTFSTDGVSGNPYINEVETVSISGTTSNGVAYSDSTTTGSTYSFTVPPGSYTISSGLGSYRAVRSIRSMPLAVSTDIASTDFLYQGWQATGYVFKDYDHNGAQDGSDGAYTGGASITSSSGTSCVTNGSGTCTIKALRPGSYNITLTVPLSYQASTYTGNCNPVNCRSTASQTATTYTTVVVGPDTSVNFGITPLYTINGTLYYDANDDGINNDNTFFDDSATVSIVETGDSVATVRTYSFFVISGSYTIRVSAPGYKSTYSLRIPPTGTAGTDFPVTANDPNSLTINNIDFLIGGWTISGNVYVDFNHNGAIDAGDGDGAYTAGATVSEAGRTVKPATTTILVNPYTYTFVGLRPATYTITLTYPSGYTGSSTNPLSYAVGPDSLAVNFYITPYYTISGNVWVDTDKNEKKGGGETNYTGSVVVDAGGSGVVTYPAAGAFKISNLISGPYTITCTTGCPPDTYILTYPRNASGNPSFSVQVGKVIASVANMSCSPGSHNTATCYEDLTAPPNAGFTGDIQNLNFGISKSIQWFQGKGPDMRNDAGFTDPIPTDLSTYASLDGLGGMPGVIYVGDNSFSFCSGKNSSGGNCSSKSSTKQWISGDQRTTPETTYTSQFKAQAPDRTIHTSYDYLTGKLANNSNITVNTLPSTCNDPTGCVLSSLAKGVYSSDSSVTLAASSLTGGNYVFLVKGDIRIIGRITVPTGNTAVFSASNDIIVDKTLGQNPNDTTTTIEGIYSADRFFTAENVGGFNCATPEPDKRLNVAGVILANSGLGSGGPKLLDRDMCDSNLQYPSVYIDERPDMILNLPELLLLPNYTWQEIAP